ncbi:Filamentous hemagglutinin [Edwardsiella hoshinae]|uniref:Filamentous hemagglutinin n=1 Tax=Edwardsiella hoshinae TaxID=93378 RepID=A0A376IYX9_9GAMM|nr:S-layer family protein [Edwardsiella hoshinae]STE53335.1 Filamentous hemagglutinin [Edwardsiella hoshinae]
MVIRTVQVDTGVPANSLFRTVPTAGGYLIETDPRFTDYRNWLSSDYMLARLGYDPASVHKRLGDGFYEQQLVRDQIGQLTGRRFLDGYADDEAQYRALLEAGATYAKAWNLRPGVALSAAQMAQLTSDIVWLVERDVMLADGTITRALVPQVYVRVKPGDLDGHGTLIAARAVDLNLKGDLRNAGTIAGRTAVKLTGESLRNLGGGISGRRWRSRHVTTSTTSAVPWMPPPRSCSRPVATSTSPARPAAPPARPGAAISAAPTSTAWRGSTSPAPAAFCWLRRGATPV